MKRKFNLKVVAMYYILMFELTLTGICYANEQYYSALFLAVVSLIVYRLIKKARKLTEKK